MPIYKVTHWHAALRLPPHEHKHTDNLQFEPVFKNSIEEVACPASAAAPSPSLLASLARSSLRARYTSSYLQLDDGQAEHDYSKDSARNIKHDMLYHSRRQTLVKIVMGCFSPHRRHQFPTDIVVNAPWERMQPSPPPSPTTATQTLKKRLIWEIDEWANMKEVQASR